MAASQSLVCTQSVYNRLLEGHLFQIRFAKFFILKILGTVRKVTGSSITFILFFLNDLFILFTFNSLCLTNLNIQNSSVTKLFQTELGTSNLVHCSFSQTKQVNTKHLLHEIHV